MGQRVSKRPDALSSPIENLPTDILFCIVDHLYFQDVKNLSLLNKRFNRFVNPRIWKSVCLIDWKKKTDGETYETMKRGAKAIARDVERAARIHTLTIHQINPDAFLYPKFPGSKKVPPPDFMPLRDALKAMPNLKSLRITGFATNPTSLVRILNGPSHPFQLESFECLQNVLPLLGPFLRAQPRITLLRIASFRDRDNGTQPIGTTPHLSSLLPHSIRRIEGPVDLVTRFFASNTYHLDYLLVHDCFSDSSSYLDPQETNDTTLGDFNPQSTVRNLSVDLRINTTDFCNKLYSILVYSFQISPLSIQSLQLTLNIIPDPTFASAFKSLINLERLEWNSILLKPEVGSIVSTTDTSEFVTTLVNAFAIRLPKLRKLILVEADLEGRKAYWARTWTKKSIYLLNADQTRLGTLEENEIIDRRGGWKLWDPVQVEGDDRHLWVMEVSSWGEHQIILGREF